jgi:hypothetical protein
MTQEDRRYQEAVEKFFAIHAEDPRRVEKEDQVQPWSVLYHRRMQAWLKAMAPEASEPLRLAVSCQHIRRWQIPRDRYPEGKLGYKKWRQDLAVFHGDQAAAVLEQCGYSEETIQRVRELLLKTDLKGDPEVQLLEDVICLVFLENEFTAFAGKHDEEKLSVILRKTWRKMSPRGHEEALKLAATLPEDLRALVGRALA